MNLISHPSEFIILGSYRSHGDARFTRVVEHHLRVIKMTREGLHYGYGTVQSLVGGFREKAVVTRDAVLQWWCPLTCLNESPLCKGQTS